MPSRFMTLRARPSNTMTIRLEPEISAMTIPIFRFDKSPEAMFFDLLNRANGSYLGPDQVELGRPLSRGRTETRIPLIATLSSPLTGRIEASYHRLDLSHIFYGVKLLLETDNDITPEFVSQHLMTRWQVRLDPEDIILTIEDNGPRLPDRVTVTADDSSLVWVGSIEAWHLPVGHLTTVLHEYKETFREGDLKRNAFLYSIDRNVSEIIPNFAELMIQGRRFHTNTLQTTMVVNSLYNLTGDRWIIEDAVKPWNLYGAEVVYHGAYDIDPTNQVIVVRLSPSCENLFGLLVIPYTAETP